MSGETALNRIARSLVVVLLALGVAVPPAAPVAAASRPTVALVVGPVGGVTEAYRRLAEEAARVAEDAGANVVRAYSPNATWPAVREAVTGASIVVYLGHGNGWPSRYRSALFTPTQNGFGLNPVAGVDDEAHQYFGEAQVAKLRFAPNAVVLLHHLCYASGNTEPGLPEGSRDEAIARVDNYAAGFLAAGARAVVAEGHLGPAYYVRELLRGSRTIEDIWTRSPNRRGHTFTAESTRSRGYTLRLDPDRPDGGYHRSLVSAGELRAPDVRGGGGGGTGRSRGGGAPIAEPPREASLTGLGLTFGTPVLRERPVSGAASRLTLPLDADALAQLPDGVQVGVRWDPVLAPHAAAAEDADIRATDAKASATPEPEDPRDPGGSPVATPIAPPPPVAVVVPERLGSLVQTARGRHGTQGLVVDVTYPAAPGLYRLVPTLHLPDGSGYDAATQALLTPVFVQVAGDLGVAWGVPGAVEVAAGAGLELPVRVVNVGTASWDGTRPSDEPARGREPGRLPARVVATWVSVVGSPVPAATAVPLGPEAALPGGESLVALDLVAPAAPGSYLVVLDVLSPAHGALSGGGSAPGIVRVEVTSP